MKNIKYTVSYHAIERMIERFSSLCEQYPALNEWDRTKGMKNIKPIFDSIIEKAEINKSIINNSKVMINLYEKYGYDLDYIFAENLKENILFILKKSRNQSTFMLVTVMPASDKPLVKNKKYNDKKKKEDIKKEEFLNIYEKFKGLKELQKRPVSLDKPLSPPEEKKPQIIPSELEQKLIDKVIDQECIAIEKISNTRSKLQTIINNEEYTFIYTKGAKPSIDNVEILKINPMLYHFKPLSIPNTIKEDLIRYVSYEQTTILNSEGSAIRHQATLNNKSYIFTYSHKQKTLKVEQVNIVENNIKKINKLSI